MKCIQATGGGALRYTNYINIKFISKHWPQESLEAIQPGAMIIPMIVSSDKTQLTHFHNKQAYLVYLTIRNIPKDVHWKPSWHAQLLIAYLPTTKLEGISNKSGRRHAVANLFHVCMGNVLAPITSLGETGLPIISGDGVWWQCHPIFVKATAGLTELGMQSGWLSGVSCMLPGWMFPNQVIEKYLISKETLRHNCWCELSQRWYGPFNVITIKSVIRKEVLYLWGEQR